jgi:hypothetical protein
MNTVFFNSKEDIRNRMLRNALDFWGTATVNDLDPFVKLLIEALSTEIFNVSNDVKNLENRVLNKISRILASDHLTSALPAHAILKALPVEATETMRISDHFYYRRPAAADAPKSTTEPADIFFTPVGEVNVVNANIRYTLTNRQLYEYDELARRNTIAQALPGNNAEQHVLWIGIDCAPQVNSLQGTALFFEWSGYSNNEELYNLLPVVKCYTQQYEVQTMAGMYYLEDHSRQNRPIFYERDIINQITRDIKDYYQNRFISLTDDRLSAIEDQKQVYPAGFTEMFAAADLNRLQPCLWFKLVFPAAISPQVLDELQLTLNCFPVMNRKLYEQKYRLRNTSNIIPVKPGPHEHFLSVKELHDDQNVNYSEIPYSQTEENTEGSYTIRNGGAERFDSRNARQTIEYLFELLRDEKAAFAAYGNDFLNSIIKTLEQNLALIEKKSANSSQLSELINYLIVKPGSKANMMYLNYWTTLADGGNHIRRGARLQQFEVFKFRPDSMRLMTSSIGGRSRLGASERIQAYKYGLTTKDRIVTQADLISFCYYELGAKAAAVNITKGISISSNPKEGLKKTTDIHITPANEFRLSAEEWDTLLSLLHSKLQARSVVNVSYRLFTA